MLVTMTPSHPIRTPFPSANTSPQAWCHRASPEQGEMSSDTTAQRPTWATSQVQTQTWAQTPPPGAAPKSRSLAATVPQSREPDLQAWETPQPDQKPPHSVAGPSLPRAQGDMLIASPSLRVWSFWAPHPRAGPPCIRANARPGNARLSHHPIRPPSMCLVLRDPSSKMDFHQPEKPQGASPGTRPQGQTYRSCSETAGCSEVCFLQPGTPPHLTERQTEA